MTGSDARKRGSHKEIKTYFLYMKCSLTDYLSIEIMLLQLGDEQFCRKIISSIQSGLIYKYWLGG